MNVSRITTHKKTKEVSSVLYLMTKAFRVNDNHSLQYAVSTSLNKENLSIILVRFSEKNDRNNTFFKEGISKYKESLNIFSNDIKLEYGFTDTIKNKIKNVDLVVIDQAYLKEDKIFINLILENIGTNTGLCSVETNVVVPTQVSSNKEEYSARTIRPKILKMLPAFIDTNTSYQTMFKSEEKALKILKAFMKSKIQNYDERNDPSKDYTSKLSSYLKYGFISPVTILNYIDFSGIIRDSFIEELVVRRELSYNFIFYNSGYNKFETMTYEWAKNTMQLHIYDERPILYQLHDYINANTHDKYFNAAMKQMIHTGYMHGYMRMYWAKKIIEWSRSYQEAYKILLYLNNYYFLDGNTPNGYTGIAWCFGKHDRAWVERPIFGKLRYMNSNGLKRKFDIEDYVTKMGNL